MNWIDLEYLRSGNERQRAAYDCLASLDIFQRLRDYQPILTGTIPIDIDTADSDLDIICYSEDLSLFRQAVCREFSHLGGFKEYSTEIAGVRSLVANFRYQNFAIELFCQPIPTQKQNAYLHMIVEARLLGHAHPSVRKKIRELKSTGIKTEPAFALAFGLPGDPYQALLDLCDVSDEKIKAITTKWQPSTARP